MGLLVLAYFVVIFLNFYLIVEYYEAGCFGIFVGGLVAFIPVANVVMLLLLFSLLNYRK